MSRAHRMVGADRLVYFSDAVVAIAITLLVLPLVDLVPDALARHEPTGQLLAHDSGQVIAFLTSFAVIARLWMVHHRVFDGVQRVRPPVTVVDLVWLLTIVVLPFPTALLGTATDDPGATRLYVGVLTLSVTSLAALTLLVRGRLAEASDPPPRTMLRGVSISAGLFVVALVVTLVLPRPTTAVLLVILVDPLLDTVLPRLWRHRRAR